MEVYYRSCTLLYAVVTSPLHRCVLEQKYCHLSQGLSENCDLESSLLYYFYQIISLPIRWAAASAGANEGVLFCSIMNKCKRPFSKISEEEVV